MRRPGKACHPPARVTTSANPDDDGSFRFYRRVHIFPGLTVNVSKSGPSLSVGVRGAHVTIGKRGIRRTVGIPGNGIYYT